MIPVNVVIDNSKLLKKLIEDRARFYGVELDYETYEFIRNEVIQMYRKEVRGDPKMRQLWHPDEFRWIEHLSNQGNDNHQRPDGTPVGVRELHRKKL